MSQNRNPNFQSKYLFSSRRLSLFIVLDKRKCLFYIVKQWKRHGPLAQAKHFHLISQSGLFFSPSCQQCLKTKETQKPQETACLPNPVSGGSLNLFLKAHSEPSRCQNLICYISCSSHWHRGTCERLLQIGVLREHTSILLLHLPGCHNNPLIRQQDPVLSRVIW